MSCECISRTGNFLASKNPNFILTSHRYRDPAPALNLCVEAQAYFSKQGMNTQVLPASLTSVKECMALAGANHITITPPLLRELAAIPFEEGRRDGATAGFPSLFDGRERGEGRSKVTAISEGDLAGVSEGDMADDSEGEWRIRFTRAESGRAETKLVDAINIFCDMQVRLEELVSRHL